MLRFQIIFLPYGALFNLEEGQERYLDVHLWNLQTKYSAHGLQTPSSYL